MSSAHANNKLAKVFDDTLGCFKRVPRASCSDYSTDEAATPFTPVSSHDTVIEVVNADSFDAAEPHSKDTRTCVLNLASDRCPGGGVRKGSKAQEEDLCRRSSLFLTLPSEFYPLNRYTVLFSDKVEVIKDSSYKPLRHPFEVSVLSMAALRHPKLQADGRYAPDDYQVTINKVRCILYRAAEAKVETLVLGAFGCGVFANPPKIVSRIFRDLLRGEFKGAFKRVVFAVLCTGDTTNYDEFAKVFAA